MMQSFRDAATLLVLVLLLMTVRVETHEPGESASFQPAAAEQEIAEPAFVPAGPAFDDRQIQGVAQRIDVEPLDDPDRRVVVQVGESTWVLSFETASGDVGALGALGALGDDADGAEREIRLRSVPRPAPATPPCPAKLAGLTS